jgi:hypothetical protein
MFQTTMVEHSRRVTSMGNIVESFFHTLANEFQENFDVLEDLEEQVKSLPHPTYTSLYMEFTQPT